MVVERQRGRYQEVDLYVPEFVEKDEHVQKEPWWAAYQQKYTADIGPFLLARLTDSTTERPMYGPRANTLWWQIRELMRHHDASALRRRAQRQASRLLSGGGLRVAFRRGSPDR